MITGYLAEPVVGRLVDRMHPRILAGFGIAGMASGLALVSRLMTPSTPLWQIVVALGATGLFTSFVWGPVSTSANRAGMPAASTFGALDPAVIAGVDGVLEGETGGLERPSAIRDARSGAVLRA